MTSASGPAASPPGEAAEPSGEGEQPSIKSRSRVPPWKLGLAIAALVLGLALCFLPLAWVAYRKPLVVRRLFGIRPPIPQAARPSGFVPGLQFDSNVHDQQAPCLPEGQSGQWSCVRSVPSRQVSARPAELYGFTDADQLATNADCARSRKLGDTTDYGFSKEADRIRVERVSAGPGFLKMSISEPLASVLAGWAQNNSHLWQPGSPTYNQAGFARNEQIGGCYSNTHQFGFSKLDLDRHYQIRAAVERYMKNVLEWWTGMPLEHTSTYGMRIYHREAMLLNHVTAHVALAIERCTGG